MSYLAKNNDCLLNSCGSHSKTHQNPQPVLLVVLPLVVEELLQDFSEGLNLVLGHALLELIAGPELLVELVLCLL